MKTYRPLMDWRFIGSAGAIVGMLGILAAPSLFAKNPKKLIYYGWNTPDTAYVRDHWREMEKMPFDGIGIHVAIDRNGTTQGDGSTGNLIGWQLFGKRAFRAEDFDEALADLAVPRWKRFKDNFMVAAIATRDQDQGLDWFDDERWETISGNWGILAMLAREGGCKGILLDPEHYDYETELFNYSDHQQRNDRSFEEYKEKARQRGRELMTAARYFHPEIVIASLYGYTLPLNEPNRYSLLPAFFDGMLEAADEEASFVDLFEYSKGSKERDEFEAGYRQVRDAVSISEVPILYSDLVTAGFGIAIDYGGNWGPSGNHYTPAELRRALMSALRRSDRYVWLYSENGPRFFPRENLSAEYFRAIKSAR